MAQGSLPAGPPSEPGADAPELIVEIYRQRSVLVESGEVPERVILNPDHYRIIQNYHASLGTLEAPRPDYLGRYRVFDLEICIENVETPRVEAR